MNVTQREEAARAIRVLAVVSLGMLSGCGGGGGSAAIGGNGASSFTGASTDTKANAVPPSTIVSTSGCTAATYTPNYSTLLTLYRWTHEPLRVRFINSGTVTTSDGTQADMQSVAVEGFTEWAAATNNGISLQITTDPAQTDVTVHFGSLAAAPTANDVLGLEQSTLYQDDTIKSADVLLNTWPSMTPGNVESFRETAAHEFGHALGINGHSDSPQDVMYAAHSILVGKPLTVRDINTLRTGYCNAFGRSAAAPPSGPTHIERND
jgi:predicted Zn-dependent protease